MTATITITIGDFITELLLVFETTMIKAGMKEMNSERMVRGRRMEWLTVLCVPRKKSLIL